MRKLELENYTLIIFDEILDKLDDNIDIEVVFPDKKRYFATIFTPQNAKTLLNKWQTSGENNGGTYLWCPDMVIVRELTDEIIISTIDYMIEENELTSAFIQGDNAD